VDNALLSVEAKADDECGKCCQCPDDGEDSRPHIGATVLRMHVEGCDMRMLIGQFDCDKSENEKCINV
jgi:hypothetical protein